MQAPRLSGKKESSERGPRGLKGIISRPVNLMPAALSGSPRWSVSRCIIVYNIEEGEERWREKDMWGYMRCWCEKKVRRRGGGGGGGHEEENIYRRCGYRLI